MLPFDNRPWAKAVARTVIAVSFVAALIGAYYLYTLDELHIPEVTGIFLLLLTIVPPNLAVLWKKTSDDSASAAISSPRLHPH